MWRWLFCRRPQPPPRSEGPPRILVRVIGLLTPGYARVEVGPGAGLMTGMSEQDWPLDWLPPECRRPNAEAWWVGDPRELPPRLESVAAEPVVAPDPRRQSGPGSSR
jgi:hypothetical protein